MKHASLRPIALAFAAISLIASAAAIAETDNATDKEVEVKIFAPKSGDRVGVGGIGWFIDLAMDFDTTIEKTGFTGFQLTGPGAHNNVAPMPGTFSLGADDHLPGLIVLVSTNIAGARSCQNLANLFNLTGVTNVEPSSTQIWDTWLVGAPNFGANTPSTVYVAVAADKNGDGIFNDAPNVVPDADGNGICDDKDLKAFGVASNIRKVNFFINR
jgi:hypothetical protein